MKLDGKIALVTGASQGIGAAIAQAYATEGARVAVVNHAHPERAAAVVDGIRQSGGEARAFPADVTQRSHIERLISEIQSHWGGADVLVNNAGLFLPTPLDQTSEEDWGRMMDLNLKAVFFLVQAVAPAMKAKSYGKIVNISSIAGTGAFPKSTAYCVTKGGLNLMTKSLCVELAPYGINVNGLAPGNVATSMNESLRADPEHCENMRRRTPSGHAFLDTRDMVGTAVFLASRDSDRVHGQTVGVDGGWTAW
ncbi:MAG: SDR family NAD(P)-dependent oxidoreductase [Gammaproteobacteria bacterium]